MTGIDPIAVNRAHWDALAEVHGNGRDQYYDVDALLSGERQLTSHEAAAITAAVADPKGLDVLHVQCHIGFDTITLARAGAKVTGVDLSSASLAKALTFAERCGVDIDVVEGNSMALPAQLHGRFDLAFASYGVIAWISDLGAWMRSVAACLRPGGALVLVELHPLICTIKSLEPFRLWSDYASTEPEIDDGEGSYARPEDPVRSTLKVMYAHSLGDVVTTAAAAGLVVDELIEHHEIDVELFDWLLARDGDGRWRCSVDGNLLPVLFTLRASKPAPAASP